MVGAPRFCHAVPTCSIDDVVVSAKGTGVDDAGAWDDVGAGALSVAAVCTSNTHQRTLTLLVRALQFLTGHSCSVYARYT